MDGLRRVWSKLPGIADYTPASENSLNTGVKALYKTCSEKQPLQLATRIRGTHKGFTY